MGLLCGESCVILASTVFDWITRVTDRQTDGRAIAYTRYSTYAVARKNDFASLFDDFASLFELNIFHKKLYSWKCKFCIKCGNGYETK